VIKIRISGQLFTAMIQLVYCAQIGGVGQSGVMAGEIMGEKILALLLKLIN
jgi:hypothetical protein